MFPDWFVFLSIPLAAIGVAGYLRSMFAGQAKPNRVTFGLWAAAPLIAFVAQLGEGAGLVSVITFTSGFGPLVIFLGSFLVKGAYWKLTSFDYACCALSLVALVAYLATQNGLLAIAMAIAADVLAGLPTLKKCFFHPRTEHPLLFWLAALSAAITLLTIDNWAFVNYGFALYLLLITATGGFLVTSRLGERFATNN